MEISSDELATFRVMLIDPKKLSHWIKHFYGYGSWQAPIWFVAFEEGGGNTPEEVAEKFNYFYKTHQQVNDATTCDLRELYRHVASRMEGPRADLFSTLFDYRFGLKAIQHGVWKNLIAFVHGFKSKKLPNLLTYQKNHFANSNSLEAWLQLFPLPSPHNHAWYYSWLDLPKMPFLKSRALYQAHLFATRLAVFLKNIKVHQPDVVVMYGMENITQLKLSVIEAFPSVKFKTTKAVRQQIPQHHHAFLNNTLLIITTQIPALHHNRIETGFDWELFGKHIAATKPRS